jgi:hypothetical protein
VNVMRCTCSVSSRGGAGALSQGQHQARAEETTQTTRSRIPSEPRNTYRRQRRRLHASGSTDFSPPRLRRPSPRVVTKLVAPAAVCSLFLSRKVVALNSRARLKSPSLFSVVLPRRHPMPAQSNTRKHRDRTNPAGAFPVSSIVRNDHFAPPGPPSPSPRRSSQHRSLSSLPRTSEGP